MVRRMLDMMYKEVRGLHQAAYVLGLFALGSQLLALLRDRMLAHNFGAGSELDIYYAAFRIPDLLFVLFASTLSVYVLIPFVTGSEEKGGEGAGGRLLSQVFTLFLMAYTAVALVSFIFMPYVLPKLFPGIADPEQLIAVSRILLLQPLLLGVSSLFGVITQLGHRFVLYALSPLVYNVGIIFGIVALYPFFGLTGLVVGVVIGALGHLAVQWPFIRKSHLQVGLLFQFDWVKLREVLAVSVPRAATLSLQQLVLLVLFGLASAMTVGSVAIFQFAYNLQSVPLSVIGVSYSVAAFPMLAQLFARQDYQQFSLHIITALRHIIFWSVPAVILIIVLRAQVVRVILGSGAFDWADTRLTAAVLALLVLSLLAQAINLVVIRAFYAGGHTRLPFYITLGGSVLAVLAAYGFHSIYMANLEIQTAISTFMRLDGVAGSEVLAIAFGYSVAMILQATVLTVALGKVFSINMGFMGRAMYRAILAGVVGGMAAYLTLNFVVEGIDQGKFLGILIQGFIAGCAGIAGTVLTYAWLKSPELSEVTVSFQKKLLKVDVVAPQEDVI